MEGSDFDEMVWKRYGVKCYCGEYKSYESTLLAGKVYSSMMQPFDCVTCRSKKIRDTITKAQNK